MSTTAFHPILSGIPIPEERSRSTGLLINWQAMAVGDAVFVPDIEGSPNKSASVQASKHSRSGERKYITRRVGGELIRDDVGQPLLDDDDNEQYTPIGTMIWRTK